MTGHSAAESGAECPVILIGEKAHPEVQGTAGWAKGPVYVLSEESEIDALPPMETALVVAKPTFPPAKWERLTAYLAQKIPGVKLRPTISNFTPAAESWMLRAV